MIEATRETSSPESCDAGRQSACRRPNGTFAPGHKFAKGRPNAAKVQKLRGSLLKAVSVADLKEVVQGLIESAKGGEVSAARLLFDRLLGPPLPLDMEVRLGELEEQLETVQPSTCH